MAAAENTTGVTEAASTVAAPTVAAVPTVTAPAVTTNTGTGTGTGDLRTATSCVSVPVSGRALEIALEAGAVTVPSRYGGTKPSGILSKRL